MIKLLKLSFSGFIRNTLACLVIMLFSSVFANADSADSYFFDKKHTEIRFYYNHGGVSEQSGEFTILDGDMVMDEENMSNSSVSIVINAKSINTGIKELDGQLQNAYYFSAKEFPKITFTSTDFRIIDEKTIEITGDLTIRGITKSVVVNTEIVHKGEHAMGQRMVFYRGQWLGIRGTFSVLRSEFGMDSFIPMISDSVRVEINAELKARKK